MIRPELFKIRHHRTPLVLGAVHLLIVLAVPAYLAFRQPDTPAAYTDNFVAVFGGVGALFAAVFGAWVVGHEYRQGTLRRVLSLDARRSRLLATKAGVGLVTAVVGLAAIAGVGIAASAGAAAAHGDTLILAGVGRQILGFGFFMVITAALSFALSVILRSDTYATLVSLATMVVFGPLLMLIPKVGAYTPMAVTSQLSEWISTPDATGDITMGRASLTLAAMLGAMVLTTLTLFDRRDI